MSKREREGQERIKLQNEWEGTKMRWVKEELLTRHQQLLKDIAEADTVLAKKSDMINGFEQKLIKLQEQQQFERHFVILKGAIAGSPPVPHSDSE